MSKASIRPVLRLFGAVSLPLLACVFAATVGAAAPTAKNDKPNAPQVVVTLVGGEGTNNNVTGTTSFSTDSNGTGGGWKFFDNATDGVAIYAVGTAGNNSRGIEAAGSARGIYAHSYNDLTGESYGVYGESVGKQATSAGVYGYASSSDAASKAAGVEGYAVSSNGIGVYGHAPKYGVYGIATTGNGVYGKTTSGYGVLGVSGSSFGVYGRTTTSYAVVGVSDNSIGVRGVSDTYYGFYAGSDSGVGGYAYTASGSAAFRAHNDLTTAGHYGIISDGSLLVNGNISCTGSCLLATSAKTTAGDRLVYAESAAQSLVSDSGTAQLKDGHAIVKIDAIFAQIASLKGGYQVFATPGSADSFGLAVINKTATSFEVVDLKGGKGNFSFDWRLSAPRTGHEKDRLGVAPQVPANQPTGAESFPKP